jgi:hypothetical protein
MHAFPKPISGFAASFVIIVHSPSPLMERATWPAASGLRGLRNVFSSTAEARLDQTGIAEPNELALRKAERKTGDPAFVSFACDEMGRSDER